MPRLLRCSACDAVTEQLCHYRDYPVSECCAAVQTWVPHVPKIDAHEPVYSDATGQWHSSQRDKERVMREKGYEPAGDKTHGARPDLRIHRKGFSYPGQGARTSTAERTRSSNPDW